MKKMIFIFLMVFFSLKVFSQNNVVVSSGSFIKLSNSIQVVLQNADLINNGTISLSGGDGIFKFKGNANSNISGSSKPVFDILQVDKSFAKLNLQTDVDVVGSVRFLSGIIDLNSHVTDLRSTGSVLNEDESNHFIGPSGGYLQWTGTLTAPSSTNPGNLGAIITTAQNLGTTTIRRGHVSQTNGTGGGSSVLRYYDIIPTNNSFLNATLRFTYLDAELNGLLESSLTVWKSTNLTSWNNLGFDARNTITNYVEKNGLNDFSRWTLSTPGSALPVHFGVFNTKCNGNSVTIKWTTEAETNTKSFEVQRSIDGVSWITISSLFAAGNASIQHEYSFNDNTSLQNNFYRIAEVDMNGRVNYSAISKVRCADNSEFKLWPNPASNRAWLSVSLLTDETADLRITDEKGRLVYQKKVPLFAGNNNITIDTRQLSDGVYLVELGTGQNIKSAKLIKL